MLTLLYAKNYGSDTVLNTDAWNTIRQKMKRGIDTRMDDSMQKVYVEKQIK